jgi:t-SNARE complex subunit (syntaxin)
LTTIAGVEVLLRIFKADSGRKPFVSQSDLSFKLNNNTMDKNEATRHEVTNNGFEQPKRTFGSKVRRSCVRFWWLYLLVLVIIVLVIVLPM